MQTTDRTGISCDHCGTQYKNDFLYYSWDFRPVVVTNGIRPQLNHIFRTQIIFSLDICTACFDKFKQLIVKNYKIGMDQKKRAVLTVCEFTGEKLSGTYDYCHVEVTKVDVRLTGQPNICVGCQYKTFDDGKLCPQCQGTDFIRPAAISTDSRFVELNLSDEAYKDIRSQAEKIRKVAGQWATNSTN